MHNFNHKYLRFFRMECKRASISFPMFLLCSLLLFLSCGLLISFGYRYFTQNTSKEQTPPLVSLAIATPQQDIPALDSMLQLLTQTASMDAYVSFCVMPLEDAFARLEKKEISAILELTPHTISDVIDGTNTPVRIYVSDQLDFSALLIRELTSSGARLLANAQAGIYTVTDLYLQQGLQNELPLVWNRVNQINLKYALSRETMFSKQVLSITGSDSLLIYYGGSGILLLCLLSACALFPIFPKEPLSYLQLLFRSGIHPIGVLLIRFLLFWGMQTLFILFLCFPFMKYLLFPKLSFLPFIPVLALISSLCVFLSCITPSVESGLLSLFLVSIILLFLSGAFIPTVFFPDILVDISTFLPTTPMLTYLRLSLAGGKNLILFLTLLGETVLLLMISTSITLFHNHQRRIS